MAYDEHLADLIRSDLGGHEGLVETRMFGGIALMLDGNMVAGVHAGGGLFRVGKDGMEAALGVDGAWPMRMGARTMSGFVAASPQAMTDDRRRGALMRKALTFVRTLPPK